MKKKLDNCPLCNPNSIGLRTHILWKHYKKEALVFFILGVIISLGVVIFPQEVSYWWDNVVSNKNADYYVSLSAISFVNNSIESVHLSEHEKDILLNHFTEIGAVSNLQHYFWSNLSGNDKQWCALISLEQYKKVEDLSMLPEDFKFEAEKIVEAGLTPSTIDLRLPSEENLLYFEKFCSTCMIYQIYGESKGKRNIDWVNFKICLPENQSIERVSEGIDIENEKCFRIKKENIIQGETLFGSVVVRTTTKNVGLWSYTSESRISHIYLDGIYDSNGKTFNLKKEDLGIATIGIMNKCSV